jgi:hypothetical protein
MSCTGTSAVCKALWVNELRYDTVVEDRRDSPDVAWFQGKHFSVTP